MSTDSRPPVSGARRLALVTGASAGIGAAFASRLARDDHDLVLVARREDRLQELAKELEGRHGVRAEVLAADLSVEEGQLAVARLLAERPVDLLVNNAGFGTFGRFVELDPEGELREISLNVVALARLTRAALGPMVERGSGGVINVSSLAGEMAMPFNATYAATKAFVTRFTEALAEELRGSGVRVQALLPGFTRTEFQEVAGVDSGKVPSFAWMEADEVVEASLAGLEQGELLCVPGGMNKTLRSLQGLAPRALLRRLAALQVRRSLD